MYARLVNDEDRAIGETVSTEVNNIDKEPPTVTLTGEKDGDTKVKLKGLGQDNTSNIYYKWGQSVTDEEWTSVDREKSKY